MREDADGTWLYYLGSESHTPIRTFVGWSGTKLWEENGAGWGASFYQRPAQDTEHHQDQPGLQITVKVYVVTRRRKCVFR